MVDASTSMSRFKLWRVFLLQLIFCSFSKGLLKQVGKTIGKEADVTPVCGSVTLNIINFIICKIRTERSREEECHLMYRREQGLENQCDSRFKLVMMNQTVLLRLNNLSPENNGSYTCECSYTGGTDVLQLNITVENFVENEDSISPTGSTLPDTEMIIIGVSIVFVIITAILGVVCMRHRRRGRSDVTLVNEQNMEIESIEPYSSFMQRENELYLTSIIHTSASRNNLNMSATDNANVGAPL